jgi:DNA-binding response OmpR family regulator
MRVSVRREDVMPDHSILCVRDFVSDNDPVAAAVRLAGYHPLTANDLSQAMALYFVTRQLDAVVLDHRAKENVGICLAQALRSIRADIPILLLSTKVFDPIPKGIDACVCVSGSVEELIPVLHMLLRTASSGTAA